MTTTKTRGEVINQVCCHMSNIRGIGNLLIFLLSEIKGADRPQDAELFGLFSFLNAEAQGIVYSLDELPNTFPPALWDTVCSTLAITNTIVVSCRVFDLEIPLGDACMDSLVAAILSSVDRTESALNAIDRHEVKAPAPSRTPPVFEPLAPAPARTRRTAGKILEVV